MYCVYNIPSVFDSTISEGILDGDDLTPPGEIIEIKSNRVPRVSLEPWGALGGPGPEALKEHTGALHP